jgi:hypothetical protein
MYRSTRTAAVSLALVAMLLRALLPAGWMPSSASGQALVICTLQGPVRIDPTPHKPAAPQHHNVTCPFAAAPQLAGPQADIIPLPPTLRIGASDVFVIAATPSERARYSPNAPRAPPYPA